MRANNRKDNELRPVTFTLDYCEYPLASVLVEMGKTRVLCCVTVENRVPPHLVGSDSGWVTAEYAMLPGATQTRTPRDISRLRIAPRSSEIQRLIGRSLRSVTDLQGLCGLSLTVDCDVLQADGGTRTASITGGWLALWLACEKLVKQNIIVKNPVKEQIAAVSAGIVDGKPLLDLDYSEDSNAETDFNMVMTNTGRIIELQGTGEKRPFTRDELTSLLDMGTKAIAELCRLQREVM
jgi:ribonuclease PH